MAKNQSSICAGLPTWLWWLFTLIGLVLLYSFMISDRQKPIETDLTQRTSNQLSSDNANWAQVQFHRRGRDLLLTGTAESEQARDAAIAAAQNVEGVRIVDHQINLEKVLLPSQLEMVHGGGEVTLRGSLASRESADRLLQVTESSFADSRIIDKLQVSDGIAPAAWLPAAEGFIPELSTLRNAQLVMSDSEKKFSGLADSSDIRTGLLDKGSQLLGDGFVSDLTISQAPELTIAETDGKVALSGRLATLASVLDVEKAAAATYGPDNVENNMTADVQVREANWLGGVMDLIPGMASLKGGKLVVTDEARKLSGEVASDDVKATFLDKAKSLFGDSLVDNLAVAPPPEPEIVVVAESAPELPPAPVPPEPEPELPPAPVPPEPEPELPPAPVPPEPAPEPEQLSAGDLAKVCQQKLDETMKGKKILFAFDKADIRVESYPLLQQLQKVLENCEAVISELGLEISGHTDSVGRSAYNMELSQRRADAVKAYLEKAGMDASTINSKGYGETSPVASNNSAEGRAQNRRITFTIKDK